MNIRIKTIHERIYEKLSKLVDFQELKTKKYLKLESPALMDLHVDYLREEPNNACVIALAHNFTQNGDLVCDPDMEIRIFPRMRMAEALTYQGSLGAYQEVYSDGYKCVNPILKKSLNTFLNTWLNNMLDQSYTLTG